MEQPPEATLVWTPAQIGVRVDRAGDGLAELVIATEGQESAQDVLQIRVISRHPPIAVKDAGIGLTEHRLAHFTEARARVGAIRIDDLFDSAFRSSDPDG